MKLLLLASMAPLFTACVQNGLDTDLDGDGDDTFCLAGSAAITDSSGDLWQCPYESCADPDGGWYEFPDGTVFECTASNDCNDAAEDTIAYCQELAP